MHRNGARDRKDNDNKMLLTHEQIEALVRHTIRLQAELMEMAELLDHVAKRGRAICPYCGGLAECYEDCCSSFKGYLGCSRCLGCEDTMALDEYINHYDIKTLSTGDNFCDESEYIAALPEWHAEEKF